MKCPKWLFKRQRTASCGKRSEACCQCLKNCKKQHKDQKGRLRKCCDRCSRVCRAPTTTAMPLRNVPRAMRDLPKRSGGCGCKKQTTTTTDPQI